MSLARAASGRVAAVPNAFLLALLAAAILVVAILPRLIGFTPYGEGAILQETEKQDSAQCQKFGFSTGTDQFSACKVDLAALRQQHEELIAAYSWR